MRVNLPLPEQVGQYTGRLGGVVGEYPLPKGYVFAPTYLHAVVTAALLFLLVLTLGQLRRRFIGWQLGGVLPGVMAGFAVALILEAIFVVGGRTIFTELMGWKNAPKPLVNVLDAGRNRLVKVLGVTDEVPTSNAASADEGVVEISWGELGKSFGELSEEEQEGLREIICAP